MSQLCHNLVTTNYQGFIMSKPLSPDIAKQIQELKRDYGSYANIGKAIGVSGSLLSSRCVNCEGTRNPKPLGSGTLKLINLFLEKEKVDPKRSDAAKRAWVTIRANKATAEQNMERETELSKYETYELITEIKKRGAISVTF